jgi:hypothetical protein
VTYYVLFFIHLESRRVDIAGLTVHPDEAWMKQIAATRPWRTATSCGTVAICTTRRKYTRSFRAIIASGRVEPLAVRHQPNLMP